MKMKQKLLYSAVTLLSVVTLAACSTGTSATSTSTSTSQTTATTKTAKQSQVDWDSLPTKTITLSNDGLEITEAGTYVLSGTTTAGVTVKADGDVRLILDNATISNADQPAILVEKAKSTTLELKDGSTNSISDGTSHTDTNAEGAIYVKSDLTITGQGNLEVSGNYQDGIVSTGNLFINSGNLTVNAADDAIRGKDSVTISGGTLDITATGDGIKSNNDKDTSKGFVTITDGTIKVKAGDDGIKAESSLVIDGGNITVSDSTEGLEGTNVTINGGIVNVYATDDGINAASDVTGADIYIKVTGGDITVEVGQGDTDGFDANGDIYVSGGSIKVTAQSAFDFDNKAELTGGTVTVNGEKITEIVATGPGSEGFGGPGGEPDGDGAPRHF